ncbi:MAG: CbiQ family ECF transporter T component, partial [Polyangia bacterium]
MTSQRSIDPRVRVLFLIASAIGIFVLPRVWMAATAAGVLSIAWLAVGLPPRRLVRQYYKLIPFGLFIVGSYALTRESETVDRWVHWHGIGVNLGGAAIGLLMILRVLAVVIASQVARAGDVRAIAHGLRTLGMPRTAAISIDAVLALLGSGPGSGG